MLSCLDFGPHKIIDVVEYRCWHVEYTGICTTLSSNYLASKTRPPRYNNLQQLLSTKSLAVSVFCCHWLKWTWSPWRHQLSLLQRSIPTPSEGVDKVGVFLPMPHRRYPLLIERRVTHRSAPFLPHVRLVACSPKVPRVQARRRPQWPSVNVIHDRVEDKHKHKSEEATLLVVLPTVLIMRNEHRFKKM
jgi:hypothetical protein